MRMIVLAAAACVAVTFAQVEARAEGAWCILDSDGCTNCAFQKRAPNAWPVLREPAGPACAT